MPVLPEVASTTVWPGLSVPRLLRVLDDGDGETILHRGERIEELALHVHRDVLRREPLDAHDGRAADGAENAVVDHCERPRSGDRSGGRTAHRGALLYGLRAPERSPRANTLRISRCRERPYPLRDTRIIRAPSEAVGRRRARLAPGDRGVDPGRAAHPQRPTAQLGDRAGPGDDVRLDGKPLALSLAASDARAAARLQQAAGRSDHAERPAGPPHRVREPAARGRRPLDFHWPAGREHLRPAAFHDGRGARPPPDAPLERSRAGIPRYREWPAGAGGAGSACARASRWTTAPPGSTASSPCGRGPGAGMPRSRWFCGKGATGRSAGCGGRGPRGAPAVPHPLWAGIQLPADLRPGQWRAAPAES